jgi:hypothetical protein
MQSIGRANYSSAAIKLLEHASFSVKELGTCRLIADKGRRRLYIDIAGKRLPYHGKNGQPAFPWETHVKPDRLERIRIDANNRGTEPWIGFCYAILDAGFESDFQTTIELASLKFGLKLISVEDYLKSSRSRSPTSWDAVELPRTRVTQITLDPAEISGL